MTKLDLQEGISYFFRTRSNPEIRSGTFKELNTDKTHAVMTRDIGPNPGEETVPIPWLFETREQVEEMVSK